jgi:hypothetical protein
MDRKSLVIRGDEVELVKDSNLLYKDFTKHKGRFL